MLTKLIEKNCFEREITNLSLPRSDLSKEIDWYIITRHFLTL